MTNKGFTGCRPFAFFVLTFDTFRSKLLFIGHQLFIGVAVSLSSKSIDATDNPSYTRTTHNCIRSIFEKLPPRVNFINMFTYSFYAQLLGTQIPKAQKEA